MQGLFYCFNFVKMSLCVYYSKAIYTLIKNMELQQRLLQPQTLISIICFIFGLGVVWATLNNKINTLEKKIQEVDNLDLNTKLAQIQTDIEWIKAKLNER